MSRIAILKTGGPPEALARFGDYPWMSAAMLGEGFETEAFDVRAGELPDAAAFDGAILTGSSAGVYEDHDWLPPFFDWIRKARGRTKLVGVCFGHQAMAQALGGRVEKSERGWGLGLQTHEVVSREPWMTPFQDHLAIPASHQDQVVEPPPSARLILRNDFCPFGGFAWDDDAISMQFHPEFAPDYAAALAEGRRARIGDTAIDRAVESLKGPNDRAMLAEWIRRFLQRA